MLVALCKNEKGGTEKTPKNHLSSMQALAKQLADVFDFVLRFDDAKVISNVTRAFVIVITHTMLDGEPRHSKRLLLLPPYPQPHEVVQEGCQHQDQR